MYGLSLMTGWRPDAQTQKVLFPTRLQTRPSEVEGQLNTECDS
jgi:hypothetical protein